MLFNDNIIITSSFPAEYFPNVFIVIKARLASWEIACWTSLHLVSNCDSWGWHSHIEQDEDGGA